MRVWRPSAVNTAVQPVVLVMNTWIHETDQRFRYAAVQQCIVHGTLMALITSSRLRLSSSQGHLQSNASPYVPLWCGTALNWDPF